MAPLLVGMKAQGWRERTSGKPGSGLKASGRQQEARIVHIARKTTFALRMRFDTIPPTSRLRGCTNTDRSCEGTPRHPRYDSSQRVTSRRTEHPKRGSTGSSGISSQHNVGSKEQSSFRTHSPAVQTAMSEVRSTCVANAVEILVGDRIAQPHNGEDDEKAEPYGGGGGRDRVNSRCREDSGAMLYDALGMPAGAAEEGTKRRVTMERESKTPMGRMAFPRRLEWLRECREESGGLRSAFWPSSWEWRVSLKYAIAKQLRGLLPCWTRLVAASCKELLLVVRCLSSVGSFGRRDRIGVGGREEESRSRVAEGRRGRAGRAKPPNHHSSVGPYGGIGGRVNRRCWDDEGNGMLARQRQSCTMHSECQQAQSKRRVTMEGESKTLMGRMASPYRMEVLRECGGIAGTAAESLVGFTARLRRVAGSGVCRSNTLLRSSYEDCWDGPCDAQALSTRVAVPQEAIMPTSASNEQSACKPDRVSEETEGKI
ncbi:hypothetical protein C8F01DRAFT_1086386 [Mycena amicta]|nr:hypothetical protein C8F01DRAFT_1086386 [Mycena amicta]